MNKVKNYLALVFLLTGLSVLLLGCEKVITVISDNTTPTMETTIKIGVIQPAYSYTTFSQGAETARMQINDNGGILGMQVEFVSRNNQPIENENPTVEASTSAAKALIDVEKVFALLGPVRSTMAVAVGPIAQQAQRLMLPGSSGSNVPSVGGDYVFLITVPNPFQGKVMASFAMNPEELNAKSAVTIYEEGDTYATDLVQAFEAAFQELGGQIADIGSYPAGEKDFTTLLTAISRIFTNGYFLSWDINLKHVVDKGSSGNEQLLRPSSVEVHGMIENVFLGY